MPKGRKPRKRSNGEGSVFWSDAQRRFVGFVTIGHDATRKPKRKKFLGSRGDMSRVARLAVEEQMERLLRRKGRSPSGATQLRIYLDDWIARAEIRSRTRATYRYVSRHLGHLGSRAIVAIEPEHIRQHLDDMSAGQQTKLKFYCLLHRVLQEATELDIITRNPADNVKAPRVQARKARVLTPTEVGFLLQAAYGNRLEAAVILSLTSTMGPGELFALRLRDVYLSERFVVVEGDLVEVAGQPPHIEETKNGKRRRRIDLPPVAVDAVRKRLKLRLAEGPRVEQVFTSAEGTLIRMSNLRRRWWKPLLQRAAALAEKAARKAGDLQYRFPTDLRMYDLRHTACALLSYAGVPLEVARERMGHASIKLTADTYGHIFPSMQLDAASRLQNLFEKIRDDSADPHENAQ